LSSILAISLQFAALDLPSRYLPSEILVFGYSEFEQTPRSKKGLDEIVFRDVFRG
jgi:hypothetical protein